MELFSTEVLVIGSGVAGLMAAERLSLEKNVTIITKSTLGKSNSKLAQGGIAAAMTVEDSWTNHFFDTIRAGVFHNNEELTELLVKKGPMQVRHLINLGVQFDKSSDGEYKRCQEGAHSIPRIFHAGGDATGKEIIHTLIHRIKKRCTIFEDHMAIDFLMDEGKCTGVKVLNQNGEIIIVKAAYTILATGGAGQLYPLTSNDSAITGDGLAMAYRAGATLTDLEFMQFHPTMYAGISDRSFLISEAVRGEGGTLITSSGSRLMEGKHEQCDLAPRDIVARAIQDENSQVYLDISTILQFEDRFPTIALQCQKHGVDLGERMIPVKPGAHFLMGGVMTDQFGRTSLDGLFALGEVAHTGVHGANRLASNSLLEGIVFAYEAAEWILHHHRNVPTSEIKEQETRLKEPSVSTSELKNVMAQYVGMKRTSAGLDFAIKLLQPDMMNEVSKLDFQSLERANMGLVSWLMATSAYLRKESRGAHYRADFPLQLQEWKQKRILRRIHQDDWVKSQKRSRTILY